MGHGNDSHGHSDIFRKIYNFRKNQVVESTKKGEKTYFPEGAYEYEGHHETSVRNEYIRHENKAKRRVWGVDGQLPRFIHDDFNPALSTATREDCQRQFYLLLTELSSSRPNFLPQLYFNSFLNTVACHKYTQDKDRLKSLLHSTLDRVGVERLKRWRNGIDDFADYEEGKVAFSELFPSHEEFLRRELNGWNSFKYTFKRSNIGAADAF